MLRRLIGKKSNEITESQMSPQMAVMRKEAN